MVQMTELLKAMQEMMATQRGSLDGYKPNQGGRRSKGNKGLPRIPQRRKESQPRKS
jgi:hypothetical protein